MPVFPGLLSNQRLDSIANEGLAFYFEGVMLQAGLFDNRPRTRGAMFTFARLRALRAITDVQLATGEMTEAEAIELLVKEVPMAPDEAAGEVATRLATPGQGMSYVLGKHQLMALLQEQRWLPENGNGGADDGGGGGGGGASGGRPSFFQRTRGRKQPEAVAGGGTADGFDLLKFHDEREVQGNLPFALQAHLHVGGSAVDPLFENVHTLFPGVALGDIPPDVATASAALLSSKGYVEALPGQPPAGTRPLMWTGYVDAAAGRSLFYLLVHGNAEGAGGGGGGGAHSGEARVPSMSRRTAKQEQGNGKQPQTQHGRQSQQLHGGQHDAAGSVGTAPDDLPLVLWLQGGNGCSSLLGLFTENGPFASLDGKTLTPTATSWHKLAHVAYLDRPAGAGFSFATPPHPGGEVNYSAFANDRQTAVDSVALLKGMLDDQPWLCKRKVWVAGESYAGHFVVQFAHEIDARQSELCVDLAGVMVGNGVVDINQTNYAWFEGGYVRCGGCGIVWYTVRRGISVG